MKQIKQDVAMNMFGVWLAYLLFWVAMHKLRPEDAWINMLFRPSFLIVAPLAVAFIPLLAAKPDQSTTRADIEDGSGGYLRRKTRWFNPNMARRMALVWLISLATFAAPHTFLAAAYWDPVFHQPVFLIVAPLLMACLSLVIPDRNLPHEAAAGTQATGGYPSRPVAWAYLLLGIALLIFFLMLLIVANNSSTSHNDGSNSELNIALLLLFMLPLALIWFSLKRLRKRK